MIAAPVWKSPQDLSNPSSPSLPLTLPLLPPLPKDPYSAFYSPLPISPDSSSHSSSYYPHHKSITPSYASSSSSESSSLSYNAVKSSPSPNNQQLQHQLQQQQQQQHRQLPPPLLQTPQYQWYSSSKPAQPPSEMSIDPLDVTYRRKQSLPILQCSTSSSSFAASPPLVPLNYTRTFSHPGHHSDDYYAHNLHPKAYTTAPVASFPPPPPSTSSSSSSSIHHTYQQHPNPQHSNPYQAALQYPHSEYAQFNTIHHHSQNSALTPVPAYPPQHHTADILNHSDAPQFQPYPPGISSTDGSQLHLVSFFNTKHPIIKSAKKHICHACGKRFTRPSSLQTHSYSHTGEKPFMCDFEGCGRHFSVVSNLRRHKKIHGIHH